MICAEISLRGCNQGHGPSGDGPLPFFLGQGVLGTGLGAAGQNSLHTCGLWPHWHPPTWAESLGMCVRQRRKSSARLLFWCLFCMGGSFGIRSWSPSGLSLKSRGSSTATQHGGVQKMHTRKKYVSNVKKKKEKRITRAAKMLCKGFTYPLPVSLVEDLDGF